MVFDNIGIPLDVRENETNMTSTRYIEKELGYFV